MRQNGAHGSTCVRGCDVNIKAALLLTLLSPGPRKDFLALILRLLEWMFDVESVDFEAWNTQQIHSHGNMRSLTSGRRQLQGWLFQSCAVLAVTWSSLLSFSWVQGTQA